jgi:HEAT repeat protein
MKRQRRAIVAILIGAVAVSPHAAPGQPAGRPDAAAVAVLQKLTDNPAVRVLALERLARSGTASARQALVTAFTTAGDPHRDAATLALVRLGDAEAIRSAAGELSRTGDPLPAIEALRVARATDAGRALLALLDREDPEVRAAAARALGSIGYAAAMAALRKSVDDRWGTVRAASAAALWRLGDRSVQDTLQTLLIVPSPEIHLMAATAWAPEHKGSWVSVIEPLLRSPAPERRHDAAALLRQIEPDAVRAALRRDLDAEAIPSVRIEAARLYEMVAAPSDTPWLRGLLEDSSEQVRVYAAGALLEVSQR